MLRKRSAILDYLQSEQRPDGSFPAFASTSVGAFQADREQPNIFLTALILDCLLAVDDTAEVRSAAAHYLQQQVSSQGSWNYWQKGSLARTTEPYPDDLDDTACALASLTRAVPSFVDSSRLGQFAALLVASEKAPGGPYNTWLIDTKQFPQWKHVDLAVNCNIGYALSLQSVFPSGLRTYIDAAIGMSNYQSSYYVGELPVIYFLSRWYNGTMLPKLREKVESMLDNHDQDTPLQQALLVSSACRLSITGNRVQRLVMRLRTSCQADHWPAEAFYIDPAYDGQQHYGGSSALTTAFALEALAAYDASLQNQPAPIVDAPLKRTLPFGWRKDVGQITDRYVRRQYTATVRRVLVGQTGRQIYEAATLADIAGGWQTPKSVLQQLNAGSLNGWTAYTLYDDILDGSSNASALNPANIALRLSYHNFINALPDPDYIAFVRQTFNAIDCANAWELREAQANIDGQDIAFKRLPDFSNYGQLANRSLGHSLAAVGVSYHHFKSMEHPAVLNMQRFFTHFLIARQLNDDAHDWEEDLQTGRLSVVVCLLLSGYGKPRGRIIIAMELEGLRQHFWRHTITEVAEIIREQLQLAEAALADCQLTQPAIFSYWLDELNRAVTAAETGRHEALQFIAAYETNHKH